MEIAIIWGIALALYLIFYIWYVGFNRPVSHQEINEMETFLKGQGYSENDTNIMCNFLKKDDGKEFVMVNFLEIKQPKAQSIINLKTYSKSFLGKLIKMAGHPVLMGSVAGGYLDKVNMGDDNWHSVFLVRYRCRRDFLRIMHLAVGKEHDFKLKALDKTFAQPITLQVNLFSVKNMVLLTMALIASISHIIYLSF